MYDRTKIVKIIGSLDTIIFVGIDVHKEKWVITINKGLEPVQTFSMESDVNQLINKLLNSYGDHQIICAYEAGFSGYWIQRGLESSGIKCLVVHPADIPTSHKEKRRKTDKLDSRKIAHHLSRQSLESIYIPSEAQERLRGMARVKALTSKKKRQTMNRIRSCIFRMEVKVPQELKGRKLWTRKGTAWLTELGQHNQHWELLEHLKDYQYYLERLKELKTQLIEQVKQSDLAKVDEYLQTIPGIGWWTSILLITELGKMNRFKNLDHLASYCGIVPDISASADTIKIKGLTQRANNRIRTALVQSAWVAIRFDPLLKNSYKKSIEAGKAPQKAIIKVTKKLLSRIRAIWLSEKRYYATAVAAA